MRYATSRIAEYNREVAYRVYMTDCLQIIAENTAKFVGGRCVGARFYDVVYKHDVEPTVPVKEIVNDVVKSAGLELIHTDECI